MNASPTPELSVVIATHNREAMLRRCLDSLASQSADPDSFEVVVAADGCSDGTEVMAEGMRVPYAMRVLRLSQRRQPGAQNAGIEAARGAVCLTLDDDIIASPTLVEAHIEAHRRDPRTIGVGALTQAPLAAGDWFAEAVSRGWAEHYEDLGQREAGWTDCFGANVSFPRQALLDAGGIATDLEVAFDFDVALRLSELGYLPRFLPAAHGVHDDQGKGTRATLRDASRQGRMHVELYHRHPDRLTELLDWSHGAGRVELELRRLAVACRIPAPLLAPLGRLLPGEGRKMIWLHFIRRIAFWQGVRKGVDKYDWWALTHVDATATAPETAGGISLLFLEGAVPL